MATSKAKNDYPELFRLFYQNGIHSINTGPFDIKVGLFQPKICEDCGVGLKRGNKSGKCRSCYARNVQVPLMRKRRLER